MVLLLCAPAFAQNGGDLDCADFATQAEAQTEFDSGTSDPNRLDADDDRKACETFDYGRMADGNDDGGADERQYGNDERQYGNDEGDVDDPDDVVPGTGADTDLPDTGGAPLLFGAAALALAAALLARRILAP